MNISTELEKGLNKDQLTALHLIGAECDRQGKGSFLVGGTVRDVLLSRKVSDIDISLECHPSDVTTDISMSEGLEILSTTIFGTQKVRSGSITMDLAMARTEEYSTPAALPKVMPADIDADLDRRDFTVNSMAVSLSSASWGQLLDPNRGLSDICERRIRVLHPASFHDDPTRIFRAFRYSERLGFDIEILTARLISKSMQMVTELSGARITNELISICQEPAAASILCQLDQYGVFSSIDEKWVLSKRIFRSVKQLIDGNDSDLNSFFLVMVGELTPSHRDKLVVRLNLDKLIAKSISDFSVVETFDIFLKPSDLYNTLEPCSPSAITVGKIFFEGMRRERLLFFSDSLKDFKFEIDGNDLLTLGINEGPMIGAMLKLVRDYALNEGITGKKAQMDLAIELLVK